MHRWVGIISVVTAGVTLFLSWPALAAPGLGVGSEFGYVSDSGQTTLEEYQQFFVGLGGLIPGTTATHGFAIGPSGSSLFPWTNHTGVDNYLLVELSLFVDASPVAFRVDIDSALDGVQGVAQPLALIATNGSSGTFGSYERDNNLGGYYGINLGPVQFDVENNPTAGWTELTGSVWSGSEAFYTREVQITYAGEIPQGDGGHIFLVADDNGILGLQGAGGGKKESFLPKTTGAVGHIIPEPQTIVLTWLGICMLALRRRTSKTALN